jgi:hypothetical protein
MQNSELMGHTNGAQRIGYVDNVRREMVLCKHVRPYLFKVIRGLTKRNWHQRGTYSMQLMMVYALSRMRFRRIGRYRLIWVLGRVGRG